MMKNKEEKISPGILEEIYDATYVEKICDKEWRHKELPKASSVIFSFFRPESVLDIGCANGLYIKAFEFFGCNVFGIEGTPYFQKSLKKIFDKTQFSILDLRKPFSLGRKFDLVMSVEVLEYIEKEFADIAVKNICDHGDTLFITACPSKGGVSHVNPQKKKYWVDKFEAQGFDYNQTTTKLLQKVFRPLPIRWLRADLMIFKRRKK